MTKVRVGSYDDLRGDAVLNSREKDAVLRELENGADAVLRVEGWLWDDKTFERLEDVDLAAGTLVHETEKAFLFSTRNDGEDRPDLDGVDWTPKSQSRVYLPKPSGVETDSPGRTLEDFV